MTVTKLWELQLLQMISTVVNVYLATWTTWIDGFLTADSQIDRQDIESLWVMEHHHLACCRFYNLSLFFNRYPKWNLTKRNTHDKYHINDTQTVVSRHRKLAPSLPTVVIRVSAKRARDQRTPIAVIKSKTPYRPFNVYKDISMDS